MLGIVLWTQSEVAIPHTPRSLPPRTDSCFLNQVWAFGWENTKLVWAKMVSERTLTRMTQA